MIEFAKIGDKRVCKELFMKCFGEGKKYTNLVFKHLYKPKTTLVYRAQGRIVSQLFLMPFIYYDGEQKQECQYIYGACTLPGYRGKGFMAKLLESTDILLKNYNRRFTFLVPAGKELYEYYGKFGFTTVFSRGYKEYGRCDGGSEVTFSKIDIDEFIEIREKLLKENFLVHSSETLKFTFKENKFFGGEILKVKCLGQVGTVVCEFDNNRVIVKELLIGDGLEADVAMWLGVRFSKKIVQVNTVPGESFKSRKFGMYKPADEFLIDENCGAYINLMYD